MLNVVRMKAGLLSHVTTDIPIGVGVGGNLQGRTASCAWLTLISDTDIV